MSNGLSPIRWMCLSVAKSKCNEEILILLGNDQLDTQLLYFTISLLWSSTCFEHYMLIIRSVNCIDAASGIVTLSKWLSGAQVERELREIDDSRSCINTIQPPVDEHIMQYVYYNPLHVSNIICSSSGGWIVLMQHLVSSISRSSLSTCAPDSHLLRVTIPDAASIQFSLLMVSI